jgi:hypothetical protein
VKNSDALILTQDILVAALLGSLLELHGLHPMFPSAGESPSDSLHRTRPQVIFVDREHVLACNDRFLEEAAPTLVILFGRAGASANVQALRTRSHVRWLDIPARAEALRQLLDELDAR